MRRNSSAIPKSPNMTMNRNLRYVEIRQGATIAVGSQVALQVFWPRSSLHKGGNEEVDNGLIVRLFTPGLRLLFLGASAMSKYALNGLLSDIAPYYLQAEIVQVVSTVAQNCRQSWTTAFTPPWFSLACHRSFRLAARYLPRSRPQGEPSR